MHASLLLLVEVILKGTAILLAGYGGAALLARSSAAHRSWCWLGVFTALLLLPLEFAVHPLWTLPIRTETLPAEGPLLLPVAISPTSGHEADAPPVASALMEEAQLANRSQASARVRTFHLSRGQRCFVAYACGVIIILGFRFIGAAQLWKLRSGTVIDSEAQAIIEHWRRSSGLRRAVRVYRHASAAVPMTWGIWRPVILLPGHDDDGEIGDLEAVLRHEFAHICHCDAARRWLGTIVTALWWPHPLVWLANRTWNLEQECACDDAVLTHGSDAESYAQQLLAVARRSRISSPSSAAALIMAVPAGLETRLRAVVSRKVDRSPARAGSLVPIGILTLVLTLCCLTVQTQSVVAAPPSAADAAAAIQKKAAETIIPKFQYVETTPDIPLQAIGKAMGVRISYTPRPNDATRLTLLLTDVPASEALQYVAQLANLKVTYQADGITVVAEKIPQQTPESIEKKAQSTHLPKLSFKNATPAEVLKAISEASGIKVVYAPAEWDKPDQTFTYQEGAPAWGLFHDFSSRAHLFLRYGEDAVYFEANPYARNGFRTPGTVEYAAETTTIPLIDWKGIKPGEAFQAITAASGIKIFYTPRPTDKPGLPEKWSNASVAYLLEQVAYPARLQISYEADGVHMTPGNPDLNAEHSAKRWRAELPQARNLLLEASPVFAAERTRRLDGENAALRERRKKAAVVNVGDSAPVFSCRTTSGEEVTLDQWKGKVVILQFFVPNQWAWDSLQKVEKEVLPKYGNKADVRVLTVFKMEAPKLEESVRQKSIASLTAADPQDEIASKFAHDHGTTYVIGKDGKIKQCAAASFVYVSGPSTAGLPPPLPSIGLAFTAETLQELNQTLQKELAVIP